MKMGLLSYWYRFCYTLWSPFYDLLVLGFVGWRRRSLDMAGLHPGERVLIVGAGTGLDLQFIKPGSKIIAIDVTEAMLRKLRRRDGAVRHHSNLCASRSSKIAIVDPEAFQRACWAFWEGRQHDPWSVHRQVDYHVFCTVPPTTLTVAIAPVSQRYLNLQA